MVNTRANKIAGIADVIEPLEVFGSKSGLLVLSWGGTYGSCRTAVMRCLADGRSVGHVHLRWLNPLPRNIEAIFDQFENVLIPELNCGQLKLLLDAKFKRDTTGLNKVQGKPFAVSEIVEKINELTCRETQKQEAST